MNETFHSHIYPASKRYERSVMYEPPGTQGFDCRMLPSLELRQNIGKSSSNEPSQHTRKPEKHKEPKAQRYQHALQFENSIVPKHQRFDAMQRQPMHMSDVNNHRQNTLNEGMFKNLHQKSGVIKSMPQLQNQFNNQPSNRKLDQISQQIPVNPVNGTDPANRKNERVTIITKMGLPEFHRKVVEKRHNTPRFDLTFAQEGMIPFVSAQSPLMGLTRSKTPTELPRLRMTTIERYKIAPRSGVTSYVPYTYQQYLSMQKRDQMMSSLPKGLGPADIKMWQLEVFILLL